MFVLLVSILCHDAVLEQAVNQRMLQSWDSIANGGTILMQSWTGMYLAVLVCVTPQLVHPGIKPTQQNQT